MIARILVLALLVLTVTHQTVFGQQIAQTPHQPTIGEKPSDVDDALADKEMRIGRDNMQSRLNFIGALNRFKIVMTEYQTSRYVPEALAQAAVIFLVLGIKSETQTAVAVLGRKFPNDRWYAAAHNLLTTAHLEPLEDEGSWISKAFKRAP